MGKLLAVLILAVSLPRVVNAQPACPPPGTTTTTERLSTCADALLKRADSLKAEIAEVRAELASAQVSIKASLDRLGIWEAQGRGTLVDIYAKLPPGGRTTQEYVNSAIAAVVIPGGGTGNIVNGDLTVTGRICLPTCRPDAQAAIQIRGQQEAEIAFESNLDHTNPQGAASHGSSVALSQDGGLRFSHNYLHARNADGSWRGVWVEPAKPRTIFGFDSRGTLSFSSDENGVIDPSQTFVVVPDRNSRRIFLDSMKPGWSWSFRTSTGTNTFDRRWDVPTP